MNETRLLIINAQRLFDEEKRMDFYDMGHGRCYTAEQKQFAFDMIQERGIRATSRTLTLPRVTLQRWCRKYGVFVARCPDWVYAWAERRQRRREFWERRGYM